MAPFASLLGLPNEVLDKILVCLAKQGPEVVAPLCLTNRRLLNIASPLLFYSFIPSRDSRYEFVRRLLHEPTLREKVKHIKLDTPVGFHDRLGNFNENFDKNFNGYELHHLRKAAMGLFPSLSGNSSLNRWMFDIRVGKAEAILLLVLGWSVKVKVLQVRSWWFKGSILSILTAVASELLQTSTPRESLPLCKLHAVYIEHYITTHEDGALLAAFFHLPVLKVFHYEGMAATGLRSMDSQDPRADHFPVRASSIEELALEGGSNSSAEDISVMVLACKQLRKLTLSGSMRGLLLDRENMMSCITAHADSLEVLDVSFCDYSGDAFRTIPSHGALHGYLSKCTRLQRLTASIPLLEQGKPDPATSYQPISRSGFLHGGLPGSLQSLTLKMWPKSIPLMVGDYDGTSRGLFVLKYWMLAAGEEYLREISDVLRDCGPERKFCQLKSLDIRDLMEYASDKKLMQEL